MKKIFLPFLALLLLSACDKNALEKESEKEVQVVPVVLRDSGAKTAVDKGKQLLKEE